MCIHGFCGIQQNTPGIHTFSSVFCILLYSPTFSVEYTYTEYSFWNTVQNTHEYIARIQVYSYSLKYSVFDIHSAVYFWCIPGVFLRIHACGLATRLTPAKYGGRTPGLERPHDAAPPHATTCTASPATPYDSSLGPGRGDAGHPVPDVADQLPE